MKTVVLAGLLLAGSGTGALAANAQVEAPIRQINIAFNKGDSKLAATYCLPSLSIIDEVPPLAWNGPTAFAVWSADLEAFDKAHGISGERVALGAVKREVVSGDTAYVVIAATFFYTQKGLAMHEPAELTYALKKTAAGWKIASQAWAGPDPTPVK
jgi:ketosteroid isomerase-like protein